MGKNLNEIAQELKIDKKVQIIYAFNGTGKTRLSKEFKNLISPKNEDESEELEDKKILYYNAFTEDLFYWDNDLKNDGINIKLLIQKNSFTDWIFNKQGLDKDVITAFQEYTNRNLMPRFSSNFSEVTFSFERGNDEISENIKISKGEESCFIWSIFYTFMKEVITVLNEGEIDEYNNLEYIFIDDPVTSLDENHLIGLAVDLAETIKQSKSKVKFIITTHNPLFFNVLYNEFSIDNKNYNYKRGKSKKHNLKKLSDGTYLLNELKTDSPFSYHLFLKNEIEKAIKINNIRKYHYNFLRNIMEKTATFLGYTNLTELLKFENDTKDLFANRIINLSSHSKVASDEASELSLEEKEKFKEIFTKFIKKYHFGKEEVNE